MIMGEVKPPPPLGGDLFYFVVGPDQLTFYVTPQETLKKLASGVPATANSAAGMDEFMHQYVAGCLYVLLLEHLRANMSTVSSPRIQSVTLQLKKKNPLWLLCLIHEY